QLGFAQPERHRKAGFDWQRDGHFNETAAHAQIRALAPYDWLAGRMQLNRDGALHPRRAAAQQPSGSYRPQYHEEEENPRTASPGSFNSPIWPSLGEPAAAAHFMRKCTLLFP